MKTKKIYIVRHGQTDYNLRGVVQGRGINASLNETGRKQAEAFYKYYEDEPFDIIYTSTLKRTVESVERFIQKGINHQQLEELDEIDWGVYEGKETNYEDKEFFRDITIRWSQGEVGLAIEGGESPYEVAQRQQRAIEIFKSTEADKILVSMHGRAMRIIMTQLLNIPLEEMDQFGHHNLCLYELELENDMFKLIRQNDITHLNGILQDM